jgi:hypothetical protein
MYEMPDAVYEIIEELLGYPWTFYEKPTMARILRLLPEDVAKMVVPKETSNDKGIGGADYERV